MTLMTKRNCFEGYALAAEEPNHENDSQAAGVIAQIFDFA